MALSTLPILDAPAKRSQPVASWDGEVEYRLIQDGKSTSLYIPNGSRVYSVDGVTARLLTQLGAADRTVQLDALSRLGLRIEPRISDEPLVSVPTQAVSLAVAQKCNLGCTYCYAEGGDFGAKARNMPLETATKSVDYLLDNADEGGRVNLAFLGGEPLMNRQVLRAATLYAKEEAAKRNVQVGYSITTNGSLVNEEDASFFDRHRFAVTVSLDGVGETHNRLRPFKSGRGSYEQILPRVKMLLSHSTQMQVSARVTVTPDNLNLKETLDQLIALGFQSVGFSPMLSSPTKMGQMEKGDLDQMLQQMIECGKEFELRLAKGEPYPFSNVQTALKEIHKGSHRPYPCGAGAGYLGVSADGDLFACHRFVGEQDAGMGSVTKGRDPQLQQEWLSDRHVHKQEPCNSCWARYLCGGGCHHEVIHRGRVACNFIRGWLDFCLGCYARTSRSMPEYFE